MKPGYDAAKMNEIAFDEFLQKRRVLGIRGDQYKL